MSTLQGRQHNNTYLDLLHIENSNGGFDSVLRRIESGNGDESALSLSETEARVDGALTVTGVTEFTIRPTVGGVGVALTSELGGAAVNLNNVFIQWRNVADLADVDVLKLNASDQVELGASSTVLLSSPAGGTAFQTVDRTTLTRVSGAEVLDGNGTFRSVGFNVMPILAVAGSVTVGRSQAGYQMRITGAGGVTITIDDASMPEGATFVVLNNSGAACTVAGVVTYEFYNGSAVASQGTITVAVGGVLTISRTATSAVYSAWGAGLS